MKRNYKSIFSVQLCAATARGTQTSQHLASCFVSARDGLTPASSATLSAWPEIDVVKKGVHTKSIKGVCNRSGQRAKANERDTLGRARQRSGCARALITDGDASDVAVCECTRPLLAELISPKCTLGSLSIYFFDSFAAFDSRESGEHHWPNSSHCKGNDIVPTNACPCAACVPIALLFTWRC